MSVRVSVESARGCGFRQPGGLYIVSPSLSESCPRLPLAVHTCPTCGAGIRAARGWTWIDPRLLFPAEAHGSPQHNAACPLGRPEMRDDGQSPVMPGPDGLLSASAYHRCGDRAGLIWVGESFYSTPQSFTDEAAQMGVSRRITAVPRGFVVGETYVFLGHRRAIHNGYVSKDGTHYANLTAVQDAGVLVNAVEAAYLPGVITLFRPSAIEYILRKGEEDDLELLASLEHRGIEPVQVIRAGQEALPL